MSERFKVQSWKGCVGAIPPWVRIPSPLFFNPKDNSFEEIDINKGEEEFRDGYDVLVLNNCI